MRDTIIILAVLSIFTNNSLSAQTKANKQNQYTNAIVYDGIYIDIGNSKYVQLVAANADNARVVSCMGKQHSHYFGFTPFITDESTVMVVSPVHKIVCIGGEFTDEFMKQLYISKIENINDLGLTWVNDGRNDDIKVLAVAGRFGNSVSFKSEQPEKLYTPTVNRETYEAFDIFLYNTKTLSPTRRELYLKAPLTKGLYALWNNSTFWLFAVE